jgi:hypothetical protein
MKNLTEKGESANNYTSLKLIKPQNNEVDLTI